MDNILLKLYVTGHTSRSLAAISNLRDLCQNEFADKFRLEIIDVLDNPEVAEQEKILATPTLVKTLPPPIRRLIGDLSNLEAVLRGLDVVVLKKKIKGEHDE